MHFLFVFILKTLMYRHAFPDLVQSLQNYRQGAKRKAEQDAVRITDEENDAQLEHLESVEAFKNAMSGGPIQPMHEGAKALTPSQIRQISSNQDTPTGLLSYFTNKFKSPVKQIECEDYEYEKCLHVENRGKCAWDPLVKECYQAGKRQASSFDIEKVSGMQPTPHARKKYKAMPPPEVIEEGIRLSKERKAALDAIDKNQKDYTSRTFEAARRKAVTNVSYGCITI